MVNIKLIDKDALVAEIERRIEGINPLSQRVGVVGCSNTIKHLRGILSFLNTLEVKEVDLEEKATQLSQKYFPDEENIWARANIEAHKCKSACIEMVEWFKAQKRE